MHSRTLILVSILTMLLVFSSSQNFAQANDYTNVTVQEAKSMVDSNPLLIVLDVRTLSEYDSGHIRNARLLTLDDLPSRLGELDKNRAILVYCLTGERSTNASQILVDNNFTQVYNMLDGITAWKNAGYPVYVRYSSLQQAIVNATAGDVLRISAGTYIETLTINKPITLEGENRTTTIISNNYTNYHTIILNANNACIQDFTIKDGYTAVFSSITSLTNITIQNNIISDNNPPMAISVGIELYGTRYIVSGNVIANNGFGIVLGNYGSNIITQNTVANNSASGIELRNSQGNKINGNFLAHNLRNIALYTNSNNNTIIDNNVISSTHGITIHDSSWNRIAKNSINDNSNGISLLNSNNNTFYHNNITNNTDQLENSASANNWDNGFDEGNYWSDYNGTDIDGDGIGDTEVPWQTVDNYPLISPYLDGDYNHDGIVDLPDANLVEAAWQSQRGEADYNPHTDSNMNGIINIADAAMISVNWLKGKPKPLIGVWWDTFDGNDYTDAQLLEDVGNIKSMGFTALYCDERSIMDGSKDNDLNNTWTARMVKLAEENDLKIVWVIWETDNPAQWINKDLNDATFRNWFSQHLTASSGFIKQHPCIIEVCFDDFGPESQFLNMTEFTLFVRQFIGYSILIEYDDLYNSLNPQFQPKTITSGYVYYYQNPSAWGTFWIDYIQQHYSGNYPSHTLGLVFEAFDGGGGSWNPTKHRPQIEAAIAYGFSHYEYFAWRWHTPELPAIRDHPEYWEGIKQNNEYILLSLHA